MKNNLLNKMKKILLGIIVLLIIKLILEIFIFQTYSNNYIGYQLYQNNQKLFDQSAKEVISFQNNEANFVKNSCDYFNQDKTDFLCKKRLADRVIENKLKQLGVKDIWLQYGSDGEKYTRVIYQLDTKIFLLKQFTQPVLIYTYIEGKSVSPWYLPFPISNTYIYIGSKGLVINKHWLVGGEKDYNGE